MASNALELACLKSKWNNRKLKFIILYCLYILLSTPQNKHIFSFSCSKTCFALCGFYMWSIWQHSLWSIWKSLLSSKDLTIFKKKETGRHTNHNSFDSGLLPVLSIVLVFKYTFFSLHVDFTVCFLLVGSISLTQTYIIQTNVYNLLPGVKCKLHFTHNKSHDYTQMYCTGLLCFSHVISENIQREGFACVCSPLFPSS